jgi:hypothetical protein
MEFINDTPNHPTSLVLLHKSIIQILKPLTGLYRFLQDHGLFNDSSAESQISTHFLLNLLYEEIPNQWDEDLGKLLTTCFVSTTEPILTIVTSLLVSGTWIDPDKEFFLQTEDTDGTWTGKGAILWDKVPKFMIPFANSISIVYKSFFLVDVKVIFFD